jgi:hypothetical protein
MSVYQESFDAFDEPEDVRFSGDVDDLGLRIEIDGRRVVDVAIDNELDSAKGNVIQRNFSYRHSGWGTLEKDPMIRWTELNADGFVKVALVPLAVNPELPRRRSELDSVFNTV